MLVGNNFLHAREYAPHARIGCNDGVCFIYVIFAQLAGSSHFFRGGIVIIKYRPIVFHINTVLLYIDQ